MELFLPEQVRRIIDILEQNGFEAYAVGGCVRDAVLGRKPKDFDVTTSARPEQVKECFGSTVGFKTVDTGLKHGTVTVVTESLSAEVTTFRVDGKYSDRRRPDEVSFSARLEDDLARRDFTVNAMAYEPKKGLIDPYGGREDLFLRKIVCVGDPAERFNEDALRIMRALRFASELGFSIDTRTAEAVHDMKELLNEIACERVAHELLLLLCGAAPFDVLTAFADVFAVIIPELAPCIGFDQHNKYHIYDVWTHSAAAVEHSAPQPDVRLALMLHDIAKPRCFKRDDNGNGHFYGHEKLSAEMAEQILRRLRFPGETVNRVTELIKYHYVTPIDDEKLVKKFLSILGEENFFLLTEVMKADNRAKKDSCLERVQVIDDMKKTAEKLIAERQCFRLSDLAADGNDMLDIGFRGKEVGDALGRLLGEVIDGTLSNSRVALLERAAEIFNEKR